MFKIAFVVAKPAVDKPEIEKDFCLAYNIPEIKLARAMTSVQKSVMLIIKAFQKTILLEEYSEELTTFHWKTAIYWESECVDHSLLMSITLFWTLVMALASLISGIL
jgi:hypothetical protein